MYRACFLMLALASGILLTIGLNGPMIRVSQFGVQHTESILSSITLLMRSSHGMDRYLGWITLLCSVVIPAIKLFCIVVLNLIPSHYMLRWNREGLYTLLAATKAFGMVEVFAISMFIVILRLQSRIDGETLPCMIIFAVGALLSLAAGVFTTLHQRKGLGHETEIKPV